MENSAGLTLGELTEAIPDNYPKNSRTVRRDLEALEASGYPIITEQYSGPTLLSELLLIWESYGIRRQRR